MPDPLRGASVVLCVTGSIAVYKSLDLASKMVQAHAVVDVALTESAAKLVTPLAFRAITHRPVSAGLWSPESELAMDHVALARRADVVVVAPATANTVARMAHGMADDAVTATVLATQAPVLVTPAMDAHMYDSAATQENLATLRSRGFTIAGPATGRLASGLSGTGRLVEVADLMGHVRLLLGRSGDLSGRTVVVSAGPTREAIDPVRLITNRSTGKMGYAVAEAARDRGASAVLVAGPGSLPDPVGVRVVRVQTGLEMRDAVVAECGDADVLIMAAAVADWRPAKAAGQKVKKAGKDDLSLDLVRNPDILEKVGTREGLVRVGFAAESQDMVPNAQQKLKSKRLDLVAANDVTVEDVGFESDDNIVTLIGGEGEVEELPKMAKYDVADRILDRVKALLGS